MKRTVIAVSVALLGGCGVIETGNVGVRTQFGQVNQTIEQPGFYTSILSNVDEYSAREIAVELENLTPKARDNLSLADLDVAVYYQVQAASIPALKVKYSGQDAYNSAAGAYFPAYTLVQGLGRNAAYEAVAKVDSLSAHQQRDALAEDIRTALQRELDANDKGVFRVTRVVIRALNTDKSIEESIRLAVANQKKLEAKQVEVDIAKQNAKILVEEARGVADAQTIIAKSLTPEYLQYKAIEAQKELASKPSTTTVYIPSGTGGIPLVKEIK
jgi:regulator of protease activity HflC (stomatin/prohibitin superfamily)